MSFKNQSCAEQIVTTVNNGDNVPVEDLESIRPITGRSLRYRGYVVQMMEETFMLNEGEELRRDVASLPGAVAVAAVNEKNEILLLRQYRHPTRLLMWEIPAGLLDNDGLSAEEIAAGADEAPFAVAVRELAEEADLRADTWHSLVDYFSSSGQCDEASRIYLARNLSEVPAHERHERTAEEAEAIFAWVPLEQAVALVLGGKIHNGMTAQAIMASYVASLNSFEGLRPAEDSWDFHPYRSGRRTRFSEGEYPTLEPKES